MSEVSTEEWRPIAGLEKSYEVSSHGRVRSLDRPVTQQGYTRVLRGKVLRLSAGSGGYSRVGLKTQTTGYRSVRVHRLVAETFLGKPESDELQVCHYDGDPTNNRVSNLRWDTQSANQLDRVRHGRHNNAARTHCVNGHEFTRENTAINDRRKQGRGVERVCIACRRDAAHRTEQKRIEVLTTLRETFVELLTQDGKTKDRRRADYNQAIFNAGGGFAVFTATDLDMVMEKFDKAVLRVKPYVKVARSA